MDEKNLNPTDKQDQVFALLVDERNYQNSKKPEGREWINDEQHQLPTWISFMENYIPQAKMEFALAQDGTEENLRKAWGTFRKIVAIGMAAMENNLDKIDFRSNELNNK